MVLTAGPETDAGGGDKMTDGDGLPGPCDSGCCKAGGEDSWGAGAACAGGCGGATDGASLDGSLGDCCAAGAAARSGADSAGGVYVSATPTATAVPIPPRRPTAIIR